MGVKTLIDFLKTKNIEVANSPNERIGEEAFQLILKEFGSKMSAARIAEIRQKLSPEAPKPPVKEAQPAASDTKKVVVEPTTESKAQEEKKVGITVRGHIDLNATKKSAAPKATPVPKAEPTRVAKQDPRPKAEAPKPSPDKQEEKETLAPRPVEPSARPKPVIAPKHEVQPIVKEGKAIEKKEEKPLEQPTPAPLPKSEPISKVEEKPEEAPIAPQPSPSPEATKVEPKSHEGGALFTPDGVETEVFRLSPPPQMGLSVVGKIDLSQINDGSGKKKSSKERKRKRIGGAQAVDIKKEAAKGVDPSTREMKKNNGAGGGKKDSQATQSQGRKSRRKQAVATRNEVSDEDVQKQIKETLARLQQKSGFRAGAARRRDRRQEARSEAERTAESNADNKVIKITEFVTVSDLASMMDVPVNDVISTCMSIDMMVSINMRLDADTIKLVAEEFGFRTELVSDDVVDTISAVEEEDRQEDLVRRPPIVTIMGHVDHGKTSLLDNIRDSNVIAGEAGGITQHIGTYNVKLKSGRRITFLDTPGHNAFTAMRARGAKATDIAIIIIAANDEVMPQTVEAINHAAAAGVPIIFAINKIDLPQANVTRVKEQLAQMNYLVEDWGGKYQCQEISAKKGIGVEELLEKVLLEADILDLKANPNRNATGQVVESSLEKGRGYVSRLLVANGTLRIGDVILAGQHYGRVKAMFNERGQNIEEAGPSVPVTVLGFSNAPAAGDTFHVLDSEHEAREIASRRQQLQREQDMRTRRMLTLDEIGRRLKVGNFQELNLIVKGDVGGSVEALADSIIKLSTDEIAVHVLHKGVGQISEGDVVLASASEAVIIGFQVRPSAQARRLAEQDGVEIRTYSVIYDAIEDVKSAMEGMLSPEIKENVTATLEVLQTFAITKVGTIAGCMVKEGKIRRTDKVRLIREGIVVHTGELDSLKRYKDDAKEVPMGLECGLNLKNYNDIKEGDIIESYEEIAVKKKL